MEPLAAMNQNITFAYGHVIGEGIQNVLAGMSEDTILFRAFLGWHADLEARDDKRNKNFYSTVIAIQTFIHMRNSGYLDDYELVEYNGRPAIELSFKIIFSDEFVYRGFVDAVLRHKETGEILVLECKTTSTTINPAQYKNSAQAIGYSVILDKIFQGLSSYKVLYLVYHSKDNSYEQLPFTKTYLMRAQWIQELLLDIESIKMYDNVGVFPMRGESCYNFGRQCEYMSTCTLATSYLVKNLNNEEEKNLDTKVYDIELTINELIAGQLEKNSSSGNVIEENNAVPLIEGDILL